MWKWHVMKAIVLILVPCRLRGFHQPNSPESGWACLNEGTTRQPERYHGAFADQLGTGHVVTGPDTNAPLVAVSSPIEENPTQPETTNVISVSEPLTTETNLIELVQPVEELPPLPDEIDGYKTVTFDKLASFAYEVPLDPVTNKVELAKLNAQIPTASRSSTVPMAIRGFMLPLKVENEKTELLTARPVDVLLWDCAKNQRVDQH